MKRFTTLLATANRKLFSALLALIVVLTSASIATAATKTWTPTTGGAWTTAGNWTGGVPVAGDDVIINSDQSAAITAHPAISLNSLTVSGNCNLTSDAGFGATRLITVTGSLSIAAGKTLSLGISGTGRTDFTLAAGATGTINGTLHLFCTTLATRTITINGNLTIAGSGLITGQNNAAFTLSSGGTLQIANTAGITASGATGAVQVPNTRTFSAGANYVYNGSAAQVTGSGLPTVAITGGVTISNASGVTPTNNIIVNTPGTLTVNGLLTPTAAQVMSGTGTLTGTGTVRVTRTAATADFSSQYTITNKTLTNLTVEYAGGSGQTVSALTYGGLTANNASGVTLAGSTTVNGTLTLTSGLLDLGANNLTITNTAVGAIVGGSATSYVRTSSTGLLVRQGITTTAVSFPVGIANYNPVTLRQDVDATPRNYSVLVRDPLSPPSNDDASGLKHSWVILQSSPSSIDVVLTFTWNSTAEAGGTFNTIFDIIGRDAIEFDAWWHNPGGWARKTASIVGFSPTTMGVYPVTATVKTPILFGGSPWTIALSNAALPIQLASFTATLQNNNVRLNWATISEVNNYGFYVEKKRLAETEWSEVANSFIAGHGTTNLPQHYSFVDNSSASGVWQYRLRQVDLDGTTHYTEPVQVDVLTDVKELAPMQFALSQNYPNPFNPSTEIKFSVEATDHAKLDVYNALGQKVATLFDDVATAGQYYKVRFDGANLSSGVYFYHLQSGKKSELKKLMLLK